MSYLVDTNVALRSILPSDAQHATITTAIKLLRDRGETLYITAQVLIEFHALATRPAVANGLGMSSAQAGLEAKKLEALLPLLPETAAIYPAWRALIDTYGVAGRQVFDARLVAVMQTHSVTHLLTMNPTDFRRFAGITIVEPADVVYAGLQPPAES